MRRGLTLIEMIFSMVIIAIVFTVVPKIIFASNKALMVSMKEDALFNAYALMGAITKLAWDENTLVDGKILDTDENTCNDYRIGGFLASRNCIDSNLAASTLGSDGADYNDVDDYNGYSQSISVAGKNRYTMSTDVAYVNSALTAVGGTSELKKITVTAASHSDNNKIKNFQSSFFYYSANLGQIHIKKEQWQ
jgi:prepilin-type N-terminal cleavage/methylation domain-containing protein